MFGDEPTRPAVVMVSDEDAAPVVSSQAGDGAAFEQLVSRYDRRLFRIAYHIVRNADDAQEVVQETIIKVFQNIGRFRGSVKVFDLDLSHCREPVLDGASEESRET